MLARTRSNLPDSTNTYIKINLKILTPEYLTEGHGCRIYENRMLSIIFGTVTANVTENWRKILNDEPHNLFS